MTSPVLALQKAVFAALVADAELAALLGGPKVFDGAPRNEAAPYLHLGEANARDWSTATEDGAEIGFAVVAWSTTPGRAEGLAITERVRAVLADAELALEGHRLVNLTHVGTETARADAPQGRRVTSRFRAVVEGGS